MSTVGSITRLAGTAVGRTAHAVTHPLETAGFAIGLVRGATSVVTGHHRRAQADEDAAATPTDATTTDAATAGATAAAAPVTEPATPREPVTPPDPTTTEPSSPSRNAAHGGPGDDSTDDWHEEVGEDADVETPVGTTGAGPGHNPSTGETDLQQPGTEPLMDPSLTKAIKSETDTLRKAAEQPTKEE